MKPVNFFGGCIYGWNAHRKGRSIDFHLLGCAEGDPSGCLKQKRDGQACDRPVIPWPSTKWEFQPMTNDKISTIVTPAKPCEQWFVWGEINRVRSQILAQPFRTVFDAHAALTSLGKVNPAIRYFLSRDGEEGEGFNEQTPNHQARPSACRRSARAEADRQQRQGLGLTRGGIPLQRAGPRDRSPVRGEDSGDSERPISARSPTFTARRHDLSQRRLRPASRSASAFIFTGMNMTKSDFDDGIGSESRRQRRFTAAERAR